MPFDARVVPIMIASPGDVQKERDIVRSTIHEWNAANAIAREVLLMPVGWETHSAPDLGGRPQEIINERLLKDCDLLVGIFWTKLGTPTGKAASGTVEEIERHLDAGKPAMVYFSATPVAPQMLDPEQFAQLQTFQAWCKERGLIEFFEGTDDFRRKFTNQLQILLSSNPYLSKLLAASAAVASEPMSPDLTEESKTLLLAAASSPDGYVMALSTYGGLIIQVNDQAFGGDTAREQARWEGALNDLVHQGYLVRRGVKGEAFQVTTKGYDLADHLRASGQTRHPDVA